MEKLVIVSASYPPYIGGVATFVDQFSSWYTKKGLVDIYTFSQHTKSDRKRKVYEITSKIPVIGKYFALRNAIKNKIRKEKLSVIMTTDALVTLACKGLPVRILYRVPGDYTWEYFYEKKLTNEPINKFHKKERGIRYRLLKFLVEKGTQVADLLVTTPDLQESLKKNYGISATNSVNILNNTPEVNSKKEKKFDRFTVLFVGRLIPLKGVRYLIEAFSKTKNMQLLIAGYGPEKKKLQAQVKTLGITDRVAFLGRVSKEESLRLMKQSHVVVNAQIDGLGVSNQLLEAIQVKTPVITTNHKGIAMVAPQAKVFALRPKRVDDIYQALQTLSTNKKAYKETVNSYTNLKKITPEQSYTEYTKVLVQLRKQQ